MCTIPDFNVVILFFNNFVLPFDKTSNHKPVFVLSNLTNKGKLSNASFFS